MPDNVDVTLLRVDIDKSASDRVQRETARVKERYDELIHTVQRLGRATGITGARLGKYGDSARRIVQHICNCYYMENN